MKLSALTWLLLPLSRIYGLLMDGRNWLYNRDLLAVYRPDVFSVCVGNLTVGGTGKTPMIEYLIKRYGTRPDTRTFDTVTLSRGYGRQTTGFRVAAATDTAGTVGDEPLQLYRKFGQHVRVCVGERRADAIRTIRAQYPSTKRILLDDAFQHRAVRPHLTLLLTDYNRPFYTDHPFPVGRLRELRHGAQRADAVIVTKCPDGLENVDQQLIAAKIGRYARPGTPVFFAGLQYDQPVAFASLQPVGTLRTVVLVSGLANADSLEQYVRQAFVLHHHRRFADHHAYTRADLDQLLGGLPPDTSLLTTEKDWVKLDALLTPAERATRPLFFLPVQMTFLAGDEVAFEQWFPNAEAVG